MNDERRGFESTLPNPAPRPPEELEQLKRIWASPKGWRIVSDVNNTVIGLLYVGAALLFFLLAGVLALIMRTQLALPSASSSGRTSTTSSSRCTARR
jgi:cytochrome c oxidase subunit I+III